MNKYDATNLDQRLGAAQRTVEVLKRRLRSIDAGEEKTLIQRQLESTQRRALVVEGRRVLSELKSAELQRYSKQLEDDVAARTEQIRTILDHVGTGFLLLGPDLRVEPGWSRSCQALLGSSDLTERTLSALLGWSTQRASDFALAVSQVFDDVLPEEVSLHEVPRRAAPCGRELELSYGVVRKDGVVQRLLATIVDVTPQIVAERAARHHERLVHILTHKDAFQQYAADAHRQLSEASDADAQRDASLVRRIVHTVKGNSATFGLDEVVAVCHEVESAPTLGADELARISVALRTFLADNQKVLAIEPDPARQAKRSYVLSQSLIDTLATTARSDDGQDMERFLAKIRQRPASDFLEPIRAAVGRLSERLEKPVDFHVRGGELTIDPVRLGPVLSCLPHLVRNALAHGLEPAHERGEKTERGRIDLIFVDRPTYLEIQVADDGRGVDTARVLALAVQRGLLSAEQAASATPQQALAVLTLDGFSTASELSDVAGRGVGLSAVRQAVEALGGTLSLESDLGQGSRFKLQVPKLSSATGD